MGKRFTEAEDIRIRELARKCCSIDEIAQALGRAPGSVASRSAIMQAAVHFTGTLVLGLRKWLMDGGHVVREEHPMLGVIYAQAHRSGDLAMNHVWLETIRDLGLIVQADRDNHPNVYRYRRAT